MILNFPVISRLIDNVHGNEIWQYFGVNYSINDIHFISTNPFVIKSNGISFLLTSNRNDDNLAFYDYALLTSKKPRRKDVEANKLIIIRWLKNPLFINSTPEEVNNSWKDKFYFKKENEELNEKGLRAPQIGALYSILAHIQNSEDKAIIVMPTGTGKTETMLAALIANRCKRLLIAVPSDALRTQIFHKFLTLGLLKEYEIIDSNCSCPIVGIINTSFDSLQELKNFVQTCNVVVSTMDILTKLSIDEKIFLNESVSHFFVDEAHHSEAHTWKELINKFDKEKVFLFTATPFRNDGKTLDGKIIFNFSLKKAQEQRYYKEINFLPIREYNRKLADQKIAEKAVEQLKADIANGHKHIIMARCVSKNRAKEVFKYYEEYEEYNPIMVYTGITGLYNKIESIKQRNHSIIVCVNMLGEGFDLPELKIAAIHDERQSIPITLQFIGRFTRTSYNSLGKASFITNIAYPPIHEELEQLYSRNADWNIILPRLSAQASHKEIRIKEFLDTFSDLNESTIPFQNIFPALSTVIFKNTVNEWNPNKWQEGVHNIGTYQHKFGRSNGRDTLIIILGKIENVEWSNFEAVQNLTWDIIIVHWDLRPDINRVFINTSLKDFSYKLLVNAIFGPGNTSQITGMNVFRVFHKVDMLSLFNVGARKGIGQDITFQSYIGRGVQDGIKGLEQGTLIKNNIFGVGFKMGQKISLGCSVKGKIWSYQRGNLDELTRWCQMVGDIVEDETINPNIVLQQTLKIESISQRPNVMPIFIDWPPKIYEHAEDRFQIVINGLLSDISSSEINLYNPNLEETILFSLDTDNNSVLFEYELGKNYATDEKYYSVNQVTDVDCYIQTRNGVPVSLGEFFSNNSPTIWFADGSQLFQNSYVKLRTEPDSIPLDNIYTDNWTGVSLEKESQKIAPYVQDSIQYYFINKIINDFQIIYDDDGRGEIADIIGINNFDDKIDIHLYHLKYAKDGLVNNSIENFYQVCGQAQKSINWKYREGREFFDHLFRRKIKSLRGSSCNRLIKGTENDLENLLDQAKWTKEMSYHVYIVQPSLSKRIASHDILLLLGNVHHYLATVGNIELKVYSSI